MGSQVDPAFRVVTPNRSGFFVWRIEDMKPVQVPKDRIGQFYKGDSYILLSLTAFGQSPRGLNVQMKEVKGQRLEQNIHFWLGSKTSQDEAGAAAYKTVELDDFLGGAPVQHREVEGHESELFLSYFPKGLKTIEGGHKSGFNHVDNTFQIRLYQVKGKRNPRISQVDISWESMNHGDAYILDLGKVLFVWVGQESSRKENFKSLEHARSLRDERPGGIVVAVEDGEEEKMTADEKKLFEQHLPLNEKSQVKATDAVACDNVFERKSAENMKLFSCREEDGNLTIKEVKTGPLSRKDMTSDDSFIIDCGPEHIWVWIGKQATKSERAEAMRNAVGFIQKKGYPTDTPVTRVVDGGEPSDFKCLFPDWPQPPPPGKVYSRSRIAKTVQTKFDASTLHNNNTALAAESQMFDDGTGKVEVWQVQDFDLVEVDKHTYGDFYAGDSYVIKYTYKVNGRDQYLIYYWQGSKSTADERGTSALKAVEMDDAVGGAATQIRVVQNKEPPHFMAMFGGKMVIFSGGKAGWQKGDKDMGPGDKYMLQVRGTSELNCKAVQVDLSATSLNSNDVFVVFTKSAVCIWAGKGSTGDEREYGKNIASRSPRTPEMVFEGQEKESFWNILGGKQPYASDKRLQDDESAHPPRLYQISNASGRIRAEQIQDFVQDDLVPEDVMLLDVWDALYLWIGSGSNKKERDSAETVALEYLSTDPAGRDKDTPIIKVKQGLEPPTFTGFFGVWDRDLWSKGKTYEELKRELGAQAVQGSLVQEAINGNDQDFNEVPKYPYSQLIVATDELPSGVNPENREIHLSSDEFKQVFKCSYEEFSKKPAWKQQHIKKGLQLF
ncbi:advillin-like isoform X1 [Haliotis asinina]|uniref:advillin-like isoform X1 n=1 Tax=Haliotis asinina TaxID=109174 RepID=UPI003531CC58